MIPNLHELTNMPGAGKAVQMLRNSGHWDESKVLETPTPGLKRWKIKLTARISYDADATVTVEAEDRESAIEAAWKKVTDMDWDEDGGYETDPDYGHEEIQRVEQLEDMA